MTFNPIIASVSCSLLYPGLLYSNLPDSTHLCFAVLHTTAPRHAVDWYPTTANLLTKILDFRGFGSSRILIQRGGILMSIGNFPETLSQAILAGIILVGRLGVPVSVKN